MTVRSAAMKADAAATALETWMRELDPGGTGGSGPSGGMASTDPAADPAFDGGSDPLVRRAQPPPPHASASGDVLAPLDPDHPAEADAALATVAAGPPLMLAHTDWLCHRLSISGAAAVLTAFRAAARGTGVIPWLLDLDHMEEQWFLRLVAPAAPQRRTLSLEGARVLAGQLREAVARRHAMATGPDATARSACPFDLHALVPIPDPVLRLGPDHPSSLTWLWAHWGTTQDLRHVAETADAAPGATTCPERDHMLRLIFWSADWTPWRAVSTIRDQWPALRFDVQPVYPRP